MGSKKHKILLALTLALVSCSRSRYWNNMVLHSTTAKRRSRAFKQKKVYQNWTIIKEVTSKLVVGNVLVSCSRSRFWNNMVLHSTTAKRRSRAFKQKKVYQNWTIIKEVTSKLVVGNVLVSCSRSRSRYWYYIILHKITAKKRSRAFKQKKVYQNWTIMKEVTGKLVVGNVLVSCSCSH